MKSFTFTLIILIGFIANAQTYTFDYKWKIGGNRNHSFLKDYRLLFNSETKRYHIAIYSKDRGAIVDNDKNIDYYFNYKENKNIENYHFTHQSDISSFNEIDIKSIVVKKIEENKYQILCIGKLGSRIPKIELNVKVKPYNNDLIYFYMLDINYHLQNQIAESLKKELKGNYIIEEYTINYDNGKKFHYFIEKIEKIDLKITLPSK